MILITLDRPNRVGRKNLEIFPEDLPAPSWRARGIFGAIGTTLGRDRHVIVSGIAGHIGIDALDHTARTVRACLIT